MGTRRSLDKIVSDDDVAVTRRMGRPVLFGFGYRYLKRIGRVCRQTLSEARKRGIPLHDPVIVVAWALARCGKQETARLVLHDLGYSARFRVRRRTIEPIDPARRAA